MDTEEFVYCLHLNDHRVTNQQVELDVAIEELTFVLYWQTSLSLEGNASQPKLPT